MKKLLVTLLILPSALLCSAQSMVAAYTLKQRYADMKATTQTYKEYKVIPELVLDREWAVTGDTIAGLHQRVSSANEQVALLQRELQSLQLVMQQKEEVAAQAEYASTHITFLGMDFNKTGFTAVVVVIFMTLLALLGMVMGRLKIVFRIMREKNEVVEIVTREFEEYKRKMLDKQTKLSRELQNERNKMLDMGRI